VTGVAAGIIRDAPPVLFGLVSSIQWFTLGSTYWRTSLLEMPEQSAENLTFFQSQGLSSLDLGEVASR